MFAFILAVLCGIYGTIVISMTGFVELQSYIWYGFAFVFFALGKLIKFYLNKRIPLWSVVSVYTLATLGVLIFVITSIAISLSLPNNDEPGLDFLIVLGTKPDLEKKGSECKYRLQKGIDRNNILVETQSHNTRENLIYSKVLIDKYSADIKRSTDITIINDMGPVLEVEDKPQTIGILTNDFHIFRSMQIAKKNGYTQVFPISARSNKVLYLHMLVRETFAIFKYKFFEYI